MTEIIGVLAVALYASVWGLTHSLLAADHAKAAGRRVFGAGADRWYRLAYNGLALLSLAPIVPLLSSFPDRELYALPDPWSYVALMARIAAGAGLVYTMTRTGLGDLSGLGQAHLMPRHAEHGGMKLVTSGVYRWVRHPLYFFALGLFWFTPRMTLGELTIYLVFTVYMYVGTFFEEQRLVREFGGDYLEYRKRVPRLLPVRWRRFDKIQRRVNDGCTWRSS